MLMSTSISRRAIVMGSTLASFSAAANTQAMTFAVDHTSKIKNVDQGNANLCWLAAAAMMHSWRNGGAQVSMGPLAAAIGEPFRALFDRAQGDPRRGELFLKQVKPLAIRLGLRTDGLRSMDIDLWVNRIAQGPVWIAGFTRGGAMGHVLLLAGIAGEPTNQEKLFLTVIDPAGGKTQRQSFASVISFYEGLAGPASKEMAPQLLFY